MNELSGKFVNVVLAIEEGRGMEFLKYPVNIVANFNGRMLESDKVECGEFAPFNTELVWEIEKKDLKRIRTSNQPLRVECITNDSMLRKERVGFCLLSLRSAMVIPLKNIKMPVPFRWQKLIGCQFDKRNYHPELYVSLTIRDHLLPSGTEIESTEFLPYISEAEDDSSDEIVDKTFPVSYLEDGFIQIGYPEEATQPYSLNLMVSKTMNLDLLLPEVLVFRKQKERYFISFKIFGITIRTKPFNQELHEDTHLNEKIVVRLLSSFHILQKFFQVQPITINFVCGKDKLGMTTINLSSLLTSNYEDLPVKTQELYYFKFPSPNGIVPKDDRQRSPCIDIMLTLRESCENPKLSELTSRSTSNKPSGDQAYGDCILDKLTIVDRKSKSEQSLPQNQAETTVTKSVESFLKNIPLQSKIEKIDKDFSINQKFLLEISVKSIIWKKHVAINKFLFKFFHPTASTFITIFMEIDNSYNEQIMIPNLQIKMPYISTINHIGALTKMWRPKLVILNEYEEPVSKEIIFNTNLDLNNDNMSGIMYIESAKNVELLAAITTDVCLLEYDIDFIEDSDLILNPPVLDEIIFIKELSDLEKWKLEEKKTFESTIQDIKDEELRRLQNDWDVKKRDLQQQLEGQMNKCRALQEDLMKKIEQAKVEKELKKKINTSTIFEEIFQENWNKYHEADVKEIIEQLSRIQKENVILRQSIQENEDKLLQVKKTTLTKEQTTNLLQELKGLEQKFEEAQMAKQYFKEQWKTACSEIHELRSEDYKQIQNEIEINRKNLSHLSLDDYINCSSLATDVMNTSRSFY